MQETPVRFLGREDLLEKGQVTHTSVLGLPWWLLQCRRPGFDLWVGKIPWRRDRLPIPVFLGFLSSSDSQESPATREIWVQSLGWEDPLEEGMAIHSSILAWRIPMTRGAWLATVHGVAKSWT